jgi:hypothetical protein
MHTIKTALAAGWRPIFNEPSETATVWKKPIGDGFAVEAYRKCDGRQSGRWGWGVIRDDTGELDARFPCSNLDADCTATLGAAMFLAEHAARIGPVLDIHRKRQALPPDSIR